MGKKNDEFQKKQSDEAANEIKKDGLSRQAIYPTLHAILSDSTVEHVMLILEDVANDLGLEADFKDAIIDIK